MQERRITVAEGEKIIGIDLGTTNSVVAVMEGGEVKVIPNQEGNRLTPSVVAFTDKGDRLVGDPAKRQAVTNPRRTVYSIKRFMGRRRKEVVEEEKLVPYKIVGAADEPAKVEIDGKTFAPPEISAMILRKLKEAAEAYLGQKVRKAVITPGDRAFAPSTRRREVGSLPRVPAQIPPPHPAVRHRQAAGREPVPDRRRQRVAV